jgi:PIN domain nuclease of toxin-antitoxin system
MRVLLDTHTVLWWLNDDATLSQRTREIIADGSNLVFLSAAVVWEIAIKQTLNKLAIPDRIYEVLDAQPFEPLDITTKHAREAGNLPMHHRDPFDRMLIAQARIEDLTLMTRDSHLAKYEVSIIPA